MDLGPKVEPSFDAAKPEAANEATPAARLQDVAASGPADLQDKRRDSEKPKESAAPKAPPIPSSALVILPPSQARFEAKTDAAAKQGRGKRKWLRTTSQAALLLILCGASFAAGGRYFGSIPVIGHAVDPAAASWQAVKNDDTHTTIATLGAEMQQIEARLDSLHAAQAPDDIVALKRSVDGLKASLDAEKTAANASIAQLSAKLDQFTRGEPRLTQTSLEKTERIESTNPKAIQATLDRAAHAGRSTPMTTASLPAGAEPQSAMTEVKPQPRLLTNWVVRDVYDGIALVEGPEGALEVMPGDTIPGAGTVRSIERRGGGWIVLTSRGLVDYAGD
ncbi:MAG: hypothetical protein WAN31_03945 [Methylovirgula sp.]